MSQDFETRYVVVLDDGRLLVYTDFEDIEEWDEVLEIKVPATMAHAFDFVQDAYRTMQTYLRAQWELMQRKLELDAGTTREVSPEGMDNIYMELKFRQIINNNFKDGNDDVEPN
jgi:hypothetical protein